MRKTTLAFLMTSSLMYALPGAALAQCAGFSTAVDGSELNGDLVCAYKPGGAGDPKQRWSEMHFNGGTLGEWGRGSDDPAGSYDANVGSWSSDGNTITYNYGSTYNWSLYGSDSTTPGAFCNGTTTVAIIQQANSIPGNTTLSNPCGW